MKLGLRLLHSSGGPLYCYIKLVVKVHTGTSRKTKPGSFRCFWPSWRRLW